MTPEQLQTLRDLIIADPAIYALLPDSSAIADALSRGRYRLKQTQIGPGTILSTLGQDGANLLDTLEQLATDPAHNLIKYALRVINAGNFDMGSPVSRLQVAALADAGVMSIASRDALLALGQEPDPVDEFAVRCAIYEDDGSLAL